MERKYLGQFQDKLFNATTVRIFELPLKRSGKNFTVEIFLRKQDQALGGEGMTLS